MMGFVPRQRHGRHAARGPWLSERQTVAGMGVLMVLGLAGGLMAHGSDEHYAWDNKVWAYAGDGMVCKRPQPWSNGQAFTLASTVRTCVPIGDPQLSAVSGEACEAPS